MLSNVLNAGKDIANKITNKFLNLSDVEVKIKTATNDDKWGPNSALMKEISDETFSTTTFHEVMTFLWYRLFTEKPPNSRRIYKGLVLLSYLVVNGSDFVAVSCKTHIGDIMKLRSYSDANGAPDLSVRRKASDICDLLNDCDRLNTERARAKTYQNRTGSSNNGPGNSSVDSKQFNGQTLGNFDDWEPDSKSIPAVIGESFMNFVTVFTQNISGPPPTETHDNFDIPAIDLGKMESVDNKPTKKLSVNSAKMDHSATSDPLPLKKVEMKKTAPVKEDPIIDFSDPVVDANAMPMTETAFPVGNLWEDDIDEEFSNLRGYDQPAPQLQPANGAPKKVADDFNPDFDCFIRSMPVNSSSVNATPLSPSFPSTPSHTQLKSTPETQEPKPEKKIGSTWNDISSLNIDLNNLCTRKQLSNKS